MAYVPKTDWKNKDEPGAVPVYAEDAIRWELGIAGADLAAASAVASVVDRTFILDLDYANLEDALSDTPVGGVLEVRGTWERSTPWMIDKSVTVRFARGASIESTSHGIDVTADGVTLIAPVLIGTGAAIAGTASAIRAVGTVASPVRGLFIDRPVVTGWDRYGIYLEHAHDFAIIEPQVSAIAYAGIMMLSCDRGEVRGGLVSNITQPTGFTNSYGVAMTHDDTQPLAVAPRTSNVRVLGVTVEDVPFWEGIDSHSAEGVVISGCAVYNCKVGISLVGSAGLYATQHAVCTGNMIDSRSEAGLHGPGIQLVGAGSVIGTPVESATAVIANNTIVGHGNETDPGSGGIVVYYTRGAVIANNVIIRPGFAGVNVYHTNDSLTLTGNVIEDAWTDDRPFAVSVYLRSSHNTVTVAGTQITRGAKSATFVNTRGLSVQSSTMTSLIDGGGNAWANATLPHSGATTTMKYQIVAPLLGFYGATPVAKPTGVTVDAAGIHAALVSLGLISA